MLGSVSVYVSGDGVATLIKSDNDKGSALYGVLSKCARGFRKGIALSNGRLPGGRFYPIRLVFRRPRGMVGPG